MRHLIPAPDKSKFVTATSWSRRLTHYSGGWNGPFPGQTKCVAYAFSSLASPVLVKRRNRLGPLPWRRYTVIEGTSFRSWTWNRRMRNKRDRRVRLQAITCSRYGTRPQRHCSRSPCLSRCMPMRTSIGVTTLPFSRMVPTTCSILGKRGSLRKVACVTGRICLVPLLMIKARSREELRPFPTASEAEFARINHRTEERRQRNDLEVCQVSAP